MKEKRETTGLHPDGKHPWARLSSLTGVLLLVLMSIVPTAVRAVDCVLETTSNYTVMLEGTNKLRLKFPVYDKDGYDCWIVEGTITIKLNGTGDEATLFSVDAMEHDISGSDYNPWMKCHKGVDGTMTLYRERSYGSVSIGNTANQKTTVPTKNDDDDTSWANLLWEIPSKYRGQSVTIKWSMHHNGNVSEPNKWLSIDDSKLDIPAEPMKQEPLLMEPVVSYSSSRPNQIMVPYMIAATKIDYLEACYNELHGASTMDRVVELGADANGFLYFDAETPIKDLYIEANYTNSENKEVKSESSKMDIPVLHQPKALHATLQPNGTVAVSWSVANPHWPDIMDSDNWEIQRNTTGSGDADDSGWASIGQVAYDAKATTYTFIDEAPFSGYQRERIYYRVRRSVSSLWGWKHGSGYAQTFLAGTLRLPAIRAATVKRSGTWNDAQHGVTLNFVMGPADEYDADGRLILRTADDWEKLANIVKNGNPFINAVMAADIDLGTGPLVMVGTAENPYLGVFDGNGHTLTFNPEKVFNEQVYAPFRYVGGNSTIRNLHTAGSLVSSQKFASGLIGRLTTSLSYIERTVENCRVSVNIGSTVKGDATNGGFVALADKFRITNSLFDGSFTGESCNSNGGFVGWAANGNNISIDNCLFAPAEISTGKDACRNFVRYGSGSINFYKCYYIASYFEIEHPMPEIDNLQGTIAYEMSSDELARNLGEQWELQGGLVVPRMETSDDPILSPLLWDERAKVVLNIEKVASDDYTVYIYNEDDWFKLVEKAEASRGTNELYVSVMEDVSISKLLPYFSGTIEGNGHTITFYDPVYGSLDDDNATNFALIRYGYGNINVRNLNFKGGIVGHDNVATVAGKLDDRANLTIENCHASNWVVTMDDGLYAAGFVAEANGARVTVRNCLYDGTMSTGNMKTNTGSMGAVFVNGSTNGANLTVENCLDRGKYYRYQYILPCIWHDGEGYQTAGGTNIWSYNDIDGFNRVGDKTDQEVAAALGSQWTTVPNPNAPEDEYTVSDEPYFFVIPVQSEYGSGKVLYTERRELTEDERTSGKLQVDLTTSCVDHIFNFAVEQGTSPIAPYTTEKMPVTKLDEGEQRTYRFDNNAALTSLTADTLQNGVSLIWETSDGGVDYFRILRYDKLHPEQVDTLQALYTQSTYFDRTARPQHNYVYTVQSVVQCEGEHLTQMQVEGCPRPTGAVRGYVRLADGTGLAGRKVTATPQDIKDAAVGTAVTDASGFFEIANLIYVTEGSYTLSVGVTGEEAPFGNVIVTFDDAVGGNLKTDVLFTQSRYYNFAGNVLYEGSSIPVSDVQFLLDGHTMMNAAGKPIVTDLQGAFSISIPQGTHRVQAVKDGHVFMEDGYYTDPDSGTGDERDHNWQDDKSAHFFWDKTKVILHGRVVGGNDQGLLPLGKSLSRNNLGDTLTITMKLEGDNASWIVRDQLDDNVKERNLILKHGNEETTLVHATRHTITIHPDSKTGEYEVPFYPVKYKVTEVYATGYPTLFRTGEAAETIDLTGYAHGDTATYSRIYHTPATLRYEQLNLRPDETYFGLKTYTALDVAGTKTPVTLWDKDKGYALGHPVFMAGSPVPLTFSAREEYYYNNVSDTVPDVVKLRGGVVKMQNGLISTTETKELELDDNGEGSYIFTPQNTTAILEDDAALRTLTITLLYDSTYYDVTPLQGYVMASVAKPQGRRVVSDGGTYLIDILRDPPGGGSSAYIEAGTKLACNFNCDLSVEAGVKLDFTLGNGSNFYQGIMAVNAEAGTITTMKNVLTTSLPITVSYYNSWQYGYTFETTERISTSSNIKNVGADADVYIGMTQNAIVEDAVAVRVVPEELYQRLIPREGGTLTVDGREYTVKNGLVKVLAKGKDATGKSVYLIRDEVLRLYMKLNSTFAHSQAYIQKELIPTLLGVRQSLMLPKGTDESYAVQVANRMGCPVYVSNLDESDKDYTAQGTYKQIRPTNTEQTQWGDSIQTINQQIITWASFIAQNEMEKLSATNLVKSYDFDGRTSLSYNEAFSVSLDESRYMKFPGSSVSGIMSAIPNIPIKGSNKHTENTEEDEDGNITEVNFTAAGYSFSMKITPVLSFNFNHKFGKAESKTKKTGFTLSMDRASNLVVDVYRTTVDLDELKKKAEQGKLEIFNVFSQDYIDAIKNGKYLSAGGMLSYLENTTPQYRNFVYRTRAGATTSPWEDQRVTQFYNPGTMLDVRTLDIDHPAIWAEQSTISNVPYDEPARFTIYLANESEMPSSSAPNKFYIKLEDYMNPKGAKVQIDGNTLPGEGHFVYIPSGEVVTKQVEVYAGADFDYEDIGISLFNPDDPTRSFTQKLSAHFVPTAGKVNISLPGDKWVVNTESAYDSDKRDFYLPVRIDGFDVNYRGFDHIELQYKLATQGDKDWVNVCSYYKNKDLMALASGTRELIKDDGFIEARFFGETSPIEQQYDLRAVSFCRHGGGYLTRSSDILSGIKDTRRPQPFGTPQPTNGILGIGDDIRITFSEQIAGNYITDVNNFEVLGLTNKTSISLDTSLQFDGEALAITQSNRNLAGKDFTLDLMVNPAKNGKAMSVMTHGSGDDMLRVGLSADSHLTASINGQEVASAKAIAFNGLRQVAYVFSVDTEKEETHVTFYDGTTDIGSATIPGLYAGTGSMAFGEGYEGEMLEVRLWNKAMTSDALGTYAQKRLTGYELGLIDNYPMNEGRGDYAYDKGVGGNDLELIGATWKTPDGISMKLDGKEGVKLNPDLFNRTDYEDYSLMFWFRTSDADGTLIANGEAQDEPNAKNHFNIGLQHGNLYFRSGGRQVTASTSCDDGAWHHAVVTVNRSRNVGNFYVDQRLEQSFAVDTLGGISGNHLYLGTTYNAQLSTYNSTLTGNIDEIAMFESALPENLLKLIATHTPSGTEMGMLLYLPFSQTEKQMDNSQRLMPSGVSIRRYKDNHGNIVESHRDTIVAQSIINGHADRDTYAPITGSGKLENIKFSHVTDGKDLYINLDVPDNQIEKTNVYVAVKEVADLQGNLMASPLTMDLYVYRNPLRWNVKRKTIDVRYGEGATIELAIENLSGKTRDYTLEGLPLWITASQTSGKISALDEEPVTLTISPYINIGDFEEIVYIVGENGITEPLPLTIRVRGEAPEWAVDDNLKAGNISMHIVARVVVDNEVAHEADDILTAVGAGHRTLGTTHVKQGAADDGLAYLTVYNTAGSNGTPFSFEFYDASTGRIYVVEKNNVELAEEYDIPFAADTIRFQADAILGTATEPVILYAHRKEVQAVKLVKGWNWTSTYLQPEAGTVNDLLGGMATWEVGDGLELMENDERPYLITYKAVYDPRTYSERYYWDNGDKTTQLYPQRMYRFFAQSPKTIYIAGQNVSYEGITLHQGWNRIGYLSPMNLPIATALSDYTDAASEGDIIKSQSEFAVLSIDAQGNREWKGTLEFLRTGEGYMLKRQAGTEHTFYYPTYGAGTHYNSAQAPAHRAPLFYNTSGGSMNVIARVEGIELLEGDRLVAYDGNGEVRGVASNQAQLFFLSVGRGDKALSFGIERDGETVATTTQQMSYEENSVQGTLDNPTVISFVPMDSLEGEGWYSIQGFKLSGKPIQKGVYIHNGQRILIK